MTKKFLSFLPIVLLLLCLGCGGQGRQRQADAPEGENLMTRAKLLHLSERGDGTFDVEIANPWDSTRPLQRLRLVPEGVNAEPVEGVTTLQIPLRRSLVYSGVHTALITELGADSAIGGICDRAYITQPTLQQRLAEGTLTDCGNSSAPTTERIMALSPDAILLSPYENATDHSTLARLGTVVVECADYMEPTPLGRAEWMRFYGLLYGRRAEADSLWEATREAYDRLSTIARGSSERPRVLLDRLYQGVWYLPGRASLWDVYLTDAGAENPVARLGEAAVLNLSAEQVIANAADADFWLIRYNQNTPLTREQLAAEHPVYSRIKAFGDGKVYGVNTSVTPIYEETPFHPQLLLAELVGLFHPSQVSQVSLAEAPRGTMEQRDSTAAPTLPDNQSRYFSILK